MARTSEYKIMLDSLFDRCKQEWQLALTERKHPYRFCVLGTVADSKPELRTVVLRDYNPDTMEFSVFTDARSAKVLSLKNNPVVELLFYHPEKLTQIRVQAKCILQKRDESLFNEQAIASQKDYTTALPPGTPIDSLSLVSFLTQDHHFLKLVFQASQVDYLQLKRPTHIRALFQKEKVDWSGTFQTP